MSASPNSSPLYGLNEICPMSPMQLSTWCLVGGAFWEVMEPLEGSALMEEAQILGLALRVCSLTLFLVFSLGFLCEDENVISQVPGPGSCHAFFTIKDLLFENISQNKL